MACSGPQETTSGRYCRERVEQYFSRYTERIRSQISTNSASSGYGKWWVFRREKGLSKFSSILTYIAISYR